MYCRSVQCTWSTDCWHSANILHWYCRRTWVGTLSMTFVSHPLACCYHNIQCTLKINCLEWNKYHEYYSRWRQAWTLICFERNNSRHQTSTKHPKTVIKQLFVCFSCFVSRTVSRTHCFKWNSPTVSHETPIVSIKTIRLFPKWDEWCFAYCFVLRRLIFSVWKVMKEMSCNWNLKIMKWRWFDTHGKC